ncbi:hypothetical protein E8E11_008786 [Didymella keratinophila]|nr:hypothetical protein E8E11_008786 [Didymella keratinophila]
MGADLYRLTATEILNKIKDGEVSVEDYAASLLKRIEARDDAVQAWAYLDPVYVIEQAKALDAIPKPERGPLHGVAIAVKDVIFTKDMPTQFNSPVYIDHAPKVDAGSIMVLRQAGALILGKTTTTEFAATTVGPKTRNPHDAKRTPGGSSSGSGAAVGDFQAPIGLGTQTGGSTIRPGSYNGIYALKPTWNSITREGQKIYSLILDTLGLYARSIDDLELLADTFMIFDDVPAPKDFSVKCAKFAILKTMVWPSVGAGTSAAIDKATTLLREHGAEVEEISLPDHLDELPAWHATVLASEGRTAFLPEYAVAKDKISQQLVGHVENSDKISRKAQVEASDKISAARPIVDEILTRYDAVITPSVPDEAPLGIEKTGSAAFCLIWTALHTPVVNVPGFKGENGMPIGLSLVAPRYHDRRLLAVSKKVGEIFEKEDFCRSSPPIQHHTLRNSYTTNPTSDIEMDGYKYRIEHVSSGQATCQQAACKRASSKIAKGELRVGTNTLFNRDEEMRWYMTRRHWACATPHQIKGLREMAGNDVTKTPGYDRLSPES